MKRAEMIDQLRGGDFEVLVLAAPPVSGSRWTRPVADTERRSSKPTTLQRPPVAEAPNSFTAVFDISSRWIFRW